MKFARFPLALAFSASFTLTGLFPAWADVTIPLPGDPLPPDFPKIDPGKIPLPYFPPQVPCDIVYEITGNGDVNGDGNLDLSDAVYILQYKFLGGPAPKPMTFDPPPSPEFQCVTQGLQGTLQVLYPRRSHDWGWTSDRKMVIRVLFSKAVDCGTVSVGPTDPTVHLYSLTDKGTLEFKLECIWMDPEGATLWFRTKETYGELGDFDPDADFQLIIEDDVRDKDGNRLDGDSNGVPGGDFSCYLIAIG